MSEQGSDDLMTPETHAKAEREYAEQVERWRQEEAKVAAQPLLADEDEPDRPRS